MSSMRFPFITLLLLCFFLRGFSGVSRVSLVIGEDQPDPVSFGIGELQEALVSRGIEVSKGKDFGRAGQTHIVAGVASGNETIEMLLHSMGQDVPDEPEELLIACVPYRGQFVVLITGSDERGTMYALLEAAEQVRAMPGEASLISSIREVQEKPFSSERSLSTYINSEHIMNGFWHDPDYWDAMFKQLAYSRFNYYDIIFKVHPPIYTIFFDVEGWSREDVGGINATSIQQERNLNALRSIVSKAHAHGINLTLGIWNHVHNPEDADRLAPYTELAIAKLIREVPFDAFQFRMHWESGLPKDPETLRNFWGSVFDGINQSGRKMRIYPRAKGLPNEVIEVAVEKEMDFAIETKYMAEQMGMPFHPAHIQVQNQFDRRHGYADLMTYPKRYDILWRMWSAGSQKLTVWGDPDYTRRWVKSTSLYNGRGVFEVMQIEGGKPMGNGSVRALNDRYVYTDYEFQRYWYHTLLFGRIGYNPESPDEIFLREFNKRFGPQAGPILMKAMSEAGMIIPRIVGSGMPDFQEARGVPEWGSGSGLKGRAKLSEYAGNDPADIQTFIGFKEAATILAEGGESARIWPQETADWYEKTSRAILTLADQAETVIGAHRNKEFDATLMDLRIMAGMAHFNSIRNRAAIYYSLYEELDRSQVALDSAIYYEKKAIEAYRGVVETVGDFYRTDLDISVSDAGHWRDELSLLEAAFKELEKSPVNSKKPVPSLQLGAEEDKEPPVVFHEAVKKAEPGDPLTIRASISDPSGVKWARVKYRGLTQFQDYQVGEMIRNGDNYTYSIPGELLEELCEYNEETGALWDFMYLIEVMDNKNNGCIYPDPEKTDPYVFVSLPHKTIEETGGKITYSRIKDKTYQSKFHDRPNFDIITPVNGDEFMEGAEVVVKLKLPGVNGDEKIDVYVDGKKTEATNNGNFEYTIRGLANGLHKINAYLARTGLVAWTETVEISVGSSRK